MNGEARLDPWYSEHLVCPRHLGGLELRDKELVCPAGDSYPVVDGIPVMLLDGEAQTLHVAERSLAAAREHSSDPYFLTSIGLSFAEQQDVARLVKQQEAAQPAGASARSIDPVVSFLVGATNGIAYRHLLGKLGEYPIPHLRLPDGEGRTLLDIGCNWGRWSIAAARKQYRVIGLDPSLGAVMAARRVARSLGQEVRFIVGDARHLPFRENVLDTAFSYSVLQHFSPADATRAFSEMGRVLLPGGKSFVQMPTRWGVRCLFHQWRRGFKEPSDFDVRYYSRSELVERFGSRVGPTQLSVDCYFGIGLQPSDRHLMPFPTRAAIALSEILRKMSSGLPLLGRVADSVYLTSTKNAPRCSADAPLFGRQAAPATP